MASNFCLHVENDVDYISQPGNLVAYLGVPLVEEELGGNKLKESFSIAIPLPKFESFTFEVSNAIPTIDVDQESVADLHEQEGIDGEKIEDIPHRDR